MTRLQRRFPQSAAREALADLPAQIAALRTMTVRELRERYREVFGEPTHSGNKDYLRKKIAWRIQERAEGGLSERARTRIDELAPDAPIRWRPTPAQRAAVDAALAAPMPKESPKRDPRLPPAGTILRRDYQGVTHEVTVREDGFEYRGEHYRSLSKIARAITGTQWNGLLFFGLTSRKEATP